MSFQAKSLSALIVESESLIRLELISRFKDMGLSPVAASTADEAIALLESRPNFDLMLTDIKTPGGSMDGVRLAHHVKTAWPPVGIIVVSGLIDLDTSDLPRGSIFLPKPFGPASLMDALARIVIGRLRGDPGTTPAHESA